MNVRPAITLWLLAFLLPSPSSAESPSVEMSPNAVSLVETVAAAMLGHVEFVYEREDPTSSFSRGLRSLTAACVPPGTTDPEEDARIEREARERTALGSQLASIADFDRSGLVSDEESVTFRMAIETVLMARALSEEQQRPVTIAQLAAAAGSAESTVAQRIAVYRDIQPKLAPMSLGPPMGLALTPISDSVLEVE